MSTNTAQALRALIADDERLLREQLKARLVQVWPALAVCGEARDGLEAVKKAELLTPDVAFLDIRMPGLTGIEAAGEIVTLPNWRGEIVFVTAYDQYAVAAFEHGAIDYLLKPVELERLAQTAQRVKARLQAREQANAGATGEAKLDALLAKFMQAQQLIGRASTSEPPLRWIRAASGNVTRMIDVEDVLFFRSDEKYTRVQMHNQEALIRTPIRELMPRLDPNQFWQIHRSTIVNLSAIATVSRDDTGRQQIHLNGCAEVLEISRSFAHLFRAF